MSAHPEVGPDGLHGGYPEEWATVEGRWRLLNIASYDALGREEFPDAPSRGCVHGKPLSGPCVACEGLAILDRLE